MYRLPGITLLFFFHTGGFAQSISGKVVDDNNSAIPVAYIKIFRIDSVPILAESAVIKNGQFNIALRKKYDKILIEVTANGYREDNHTLLLNTSIHSYSINFVLRKIIYKELETVKMLAKPNPIGIKNDTTTYDLKAFKDGTERKLEDVLKKLPGIQVNAKTGEIKFKGKPIEKMLIEGDDLFGNNYILGTKNIPAEMVQGIQAIENFSDNYVLKGIEKDEKVAINLLIKKSKLKISGTADVGIGVFGNGKLLKNYNANTIGINSLHKFFSTLSYNNDGINRSPIDYFGNNINSEQLKEISLLTNRFINDPDFSSLVDEGRSNFNDQFFSNYNGLFKMGKKTSIKLNMLGIKDKILNQQLSNSKYFLSSDTITNIDSSLMQKNPGYLRADIYLRNNINQKTLFEYSTSVRLEKIHSNMYDYTNYSPFFESELDTKNLFLKNELRFTKRIAKRSAFQIIATQASSKTKQQLVITPPVYNLSEFKKNFQKVDQTKQSLDLEGVVLGAYKYGSYSIGFKESYVSNVFYSLLNSDSLHYTVSNFPNDSRYTKLLLQQRSSFSFKKRDWSIETSYFITYLNQYLNNQIKLTQSKKHNFYFEPYIYTSLRISYYSRLTARFSLTQKPNVENYIFENNLIQGIRSISANNPSLNPEKSYQGSLSYAYINLYNQFDFGAGLSYQNRIGGYLPHYLISQALIISKFQFYPTEFSNADFFISSSKYFPEILSTVKASVNISRFKYQNFVNEDTIRNNLSYRGGIDLLYKTMFKNNINFENNLLTNAATSKNDNDDSQSSITQLKNQFRVIAKIKKEISITATWDYFVPNTSAFENSYHFLDADIAYKPINKKYELRGIIKNLLDNRSFLGYDISDYFYSSFRVITIPMRVAIMASYFF